jgi:predicted amidohydrolase YtcJ
MHQLSNPLFINETNNMHAKILFLMVAVSLLTSGCQTRMEAVDLLLVNGVIYTVDESFTVAEAMVVKDGIVIDVGDEARLRKQYRPEQSVDLQGSAVFPGFYDPHCHFHGYGAGLALWADLTPASSFEEVLTIMEKFAGERDTGWLAGRGWDENNWAERTVPDNTLLNRLFPDRPVILIRVDGHAALANEVALQAGNINAATVIPGGEVIVKNGKPTGLLIDKASDLLRRMFNEASLAGQQGEELLRQGILQAQENCFAVGITTVGDAGLGYKQVRLLEKLQDEGVLKMSVYAMLNYTTENIHHYIQKGPLVSDRMHIRSVKFFADGALGSRGALLLDPYSDRPESHGLLTLDPDSFRIHCREIFDYGYQVNTHAIGDSANRFVLGVYAGILHPDNDFRWRIEHAQVIHPDDIVMFSRYNIIPAINAIHATSDMGWASDRIGPIRVQHAYAYRQLLKTNGWLCNGSDFPVEPINPIYGFFAAVARQDHAGNPPCGWFPEQALTRIEALKAMTIWAARACFEEKRKGSLEPGKVADFVVLNQDILTVEQQMIPRTDVMQTWIRGEQVWRKMHFNDR